MARRASKQSFHTKIGRAIKAHKLLSSTLAACLLAACLFVGFAAAQNSQKFSKEDYDRLAAMAETVLKDSGGSNIQINRTCSYEQPGYFSPHHLYCRTEMVTYLPYENDAHAIAVGKTLERNLVSVGPVLITPNETNFYGSPSNNLWTAPVNLGAPYPRAQCNFSIQTNRDAKRIFGFPEISSNGLIALSFECSPESQAEYFPVTYRQP